MVDLEYITPNFRRGKFFMGRLATALRKITVLWFLWGILATTTASSADASDTLSIPVSAGWNMISLPGSPADNHASILFPGAISSAYLYNNGYATQDTLTPGLGYWLKFPAADTIKFIGVPVIDQSISVKAGWNLIGALAVSIPTAQIT